MFTYVTYAVQIIPVFISFVLLWFPFTDLSVYDKVQV